MSIEAMKTALEALDCLIYNKPYAGRFADALIGLRTAIQQAEAQQVENSTATTKPVAWLSTDSIGERYLCFAKPFDDPGAKPLVHPAPSVLDDVARDAERYRWLRKTRFIWGDFRYTSGVHPTVVGLEFQWFLTQAQKPTREDLDAAIDAAKEK